MNKMSEPNRSDIQSTCPVCGARMEDGILQMVAYLGGGAQMRWIQIAPGVTPDVALLRGDYRFEVMGISQLTEGLMTWGASRCLNCRLLLARY